MSIAIRSVLVRAAGIAALAVVPRPVAADVTFDGKLGQAGTLSGPNVRIPAGRGQQRGANLFHSFLRFDVPTGGSVAFDGPVNTSNVIARVTGGSASRINGVLRSNPPAANLYLMNPSGILFGPGSSIDVGGSFVAFAGDAMLFTDQSAFLVGDGVTDVLTSAPPAAFGFLQQSGPVRMKGRPGLDGRARLEAKPGTTISLIGNGIEAAEASVNAQSGFVNLISVAAPEPGAPGLVAFNGIGSFAARPAAVAAVTRAGPVRLGTGASLNVSGVSSPAGVVGVVGSDVTLSGNAQLTSRVFGPGGLVAAGGVNLVARDHLRLSDRAFVIGGSVPDSPTAAGAGSAIDLQSPRITFTGQSGIFGTGFGDVGGSPVRLSANTVELLGGPTIVASTSGAAPGGDIAVTAGRLILDAGGRVTDLGFGLRTRANIGSGTTGSGASGSIKIAARRSVQILGGASVSAIAANTPAAGGNVSIATPRLDMRGKQSRVLTGSLSGGNAGSISIKARDVQISGAEAGLNTIAGRNAAGDRTGRAGDVTIEAARVELMNGGSITAATAGNGDAGTVIVNADEVVLNGASILSGTAAVVAGQPIESDEVSLIKGRGGSVSMKGKALRVSGGALVSTVNAGSFGAAGDIVLEFDRVSLGGRGDEQFLQAGARKGISTISAETAGPAAGGNITIRAGRVSMDGGGLISARSSFLGQPSGRIAIQAGEMIMRGRSSVANVSAGDSKSIDVTIDNDLVLQGNHDLPTLGGSFDLGEGRPGPSFDARAAGDGGNITVKVGGLMLLRTGAINARTGGNGGVVTITAPQVVLGDSVINGIAEGRDVRVMVVADNLLLGSDSEILTDAPDFTVDTNLTAALQSIEAALSFNTMILPENCFTQMIGKRPVSTFTVVPTGGLRLGTAP